MGIETPKIEVRYENLSIEGDVYVGSRALPTLLNATLNTIEVVFSFYLFMYFLSIFVLLFRELVRKIETIESQFSFYVLCCLCIQKN